MEFLEVLQFLQNVAYVFIEYILNFQTSATLNFAVTAVAIYMISKKKNCTKS